MAQSQKTMFIPRRCLLSLGLDAPFYVGLIGPKDWTILVECKDEFPFVTTLICTLKSPNIFGTSVSKPLSWDYMLTGCTVFLRWAVYMANSIQGLLRQRIYWPLICALVHSTTAMI